MPKNRKLAPKKSFKLGFKEGDLAFCTYTNSFVRVKTVTRRFIERKWPQGHFEETPEKPFNARKHIESNSIILPFPIEPRTNRESDYITRLDENHFRPMTVADIIALRDETISTINERFRKILESLNFEK